MRKLAPTPENYHSAKKIGILMIIVNHDGTEKDNSSDSESK